MNKLTQYRINIQVTFSQFVNTLFGGDPDETLCSRLYRKYPNSALRSFFDFVLGKGHCKRMADSDDGKAILKQKLGMTT